MSGGGSGWRDLLKDAVEVAASERKRERNRFISDTRNISYTSLSTEADSYLVRAAARRGISKSGYIRRAIMALVAMDLGLEATELFAIDKGVGVAGSGGYHATQDLDGKRFGKWKVKPDDS